MPGPDLKTTFEQVPELYDRARPNYPPQVFDDLVALARLPEAARIVEIGCGTGQGTLPLAERGFRITCVELGEQLAAVARGKLLRFPAVEVINADFETWQPERGEFEAVVAFTSFHWIAPEVRYAKAASLLRDHGTLGVVATEHVLPRDGDDFRENRRPERGDLRQRPIPQHRRPPLRLGRRLHG
jgi:trans-aconitate methyltransferase